MNSSASFGRVRSAALGRPAKAMSELEVVPIEIPDRVLAQVIGLVPRCLNDFDAVDAVELVELVIGAAASLGRGVRMSLLLIGTRVFCAV